jgi:hypothetical protein
VLEPLEDAAGRHLGMMGDGRWAMAGIWAWGDVEAPGCCLPTSALPSNGRGRPGTPYSDVTWRRPSEVQAVAQAEAAYHPLIGRKVNVGSG